MKDSWEARALFWEFPGKAATGDSKTQHSLDDGGSAETALLERSNAQVEK